MSDLNMMEGILTKKIGWGSLQNLKKPSLILWEETFINVNQHPLWIHNSYNKHASSRIRTTTRRKQGSTEWESWWANELSHHGWFSYNKYSWHMVHSQRCPHGVSQYHKGNPSRENLMDWGLIKNHPCDKLGCVNSLWTLKSWYSLAGPSPIVPVSGDFISLKSCFEIWAWLSLSC